MKTPPTVFTACLTALFALGTGAIEAKAETQSRYIVFEHSESPDGRYAVAWGLATAELLDTTDADRLFGRFHHRNVENYLVDLRKNEVLCTIGSKHFKLRHRARNHFSLSVLWRADSKAVVVAEHAKWFTPFVAVIYVSDSLGNDPFKRPADQLVITQALVETHLKLLQKGAPQHMDDFHSLSHHFGPVKWEANHRVRFHAKARIPKKRSFPESTFILNVPADGLAGLLEGP